MTAPKLSTSDRVESGQVTKVVLEKKFVELSPKAIATFSLLNVECLKFVNTAPQNVTGWSGGQDGQTVRMLGDGQTTIINNGAPANPYDPIFTNTGANKLLVLNMVYRFTRFDGKWREDI